MLWKLGVFFMLFSGQLWAQEQIVVRLNEAGILKVLRLALKYNTSKPQDRTVVIPKDIYEFTIPREDLVTNPIVSVVNEVSDLNMTKDLNFYLKTSDISVTGEIDASSLKATILKSSSNSFDLALSIGLPRVTVKGPELSLCEDRARKGKNCGQGLKATMRDVVISTTTAPVVLSMVMQLKTDGKVARVNVKSVKSNLEAKGGPKLNINFNPAILVPKIAISINGQESELDTSGLKNEILKYKSFLSKKLMAFAGDFVAEDLAEMVNRYLIHEEVATSYQIYRKDRMASFDEFNFDRIQFPDPNAPKYPSIDPKLAAFLRGEKINPFDKIMKALAKAIHTAQVDVMLKKISTPLNKDIELAGQMNFVINKKEIRVRDTLGNAGTPLPKIDLNSQRNNDVSLAISEPFINGALDVASSAKIFQKVFDETYPYPGFSIKSVKLHFQGPNSAIVVANVEVNLMELESTFENFMGDMIERYWNRNNNGVIYFPLEVGVNLVLKKLPSGAQGLAVKVLSPFSETGLKNKMKYPSNLSDTTKIVRNGIIDNLREKLEEHFNKTYDINLTDFLDQAGVSFTPKSLSINQSAYLMLNLDIKDIKFSSERSSAE